MIPQDRWPKTVLVSNRDSGGAGVACVRLHHGLQELGFTSRLLLNAGAREDDYRSFLPDMDIRNGTFGAFRYKLRQKISLFSEKRSIKKLSGFRPSGLERISLPTSRFDLTDSRSIRDSDIINLHWVAGLLDWPTFFRKIGKPVVWTLHDENAFRGMQHYEEEWLGIDDAGDPIKRRKSKEEEFWEKRYTDNKIKWLKDFNDLHIVCPSKWLMDRSQASEVLGRFPHYHIPYGLPSNIFRVLDREFCREILGLPKNKFIVLFVSEDTANKRKGFEYLLKAISLLPKFISANMALVSVGRKITVDSGISLHQLGYIHDERLMALVYNAAHVFVIPSLIDNLPNTMLESLLCGTMVIGFPVGGILDAVEHKVNGFLSDTISACALSNTIQFAYNNFESLDRNDIHLKSKILYSLQTQSSKYSDIFKRV